MKQALAVLAMMLVLVFALADTSTAGVLRGENYDNPGNDGGGDGENGNHPWGGDRIIGGGGTEDKTVRSLAVTGNVALDLILARFLQYLSGGTTFTGGNSNTGGTGSTGSTGGTTSYLTTAPSQDPERSYASASAVRFDSQVRKAEQR